MFGGKGSHFGSGKGQGLAGRFTFPEQHAVNNSKTPPGWGVEQEASYPFNCWVKDLITWSHATDLEQEKQAHAVVLRLQGTTRVLAQELNPQVLSYGDTVDLGDGNGPQAVPGLTVLVHRLTQRYGSQPIETQLKSVIEMMSFERMPGEPMDNALTRFDVLSYRSSGQAGFDLSIPGKSFWLLSRCKVPLSAWTNIFMQARTTNSFFPTTEDEFTRLKSTLRMNSHMHESGPHNIIQLANRGHSAQGATYAVSVYDGSSTSAGAESSYYATDNMSYAYPTDWSSAPETPTVCEMCNSSEAYSFYEDYEDDTATESEDETPDWDTEFAGLVQQHGFQKVQDDITEDYLFARQRYRRFTRRPTRRRRFHNRKGKGRGKGKGLSFGPRFMCSSCSTYEDCELVAFAGKGGKSRSKFPPRQNPVGADGQIMKCSICGSTTHLRRFCPQGKGKGKSSPGKGKGSFPAAHLTTNTAGSSSSGANHSQPPDMSASYAMANMAKAMQTGTNSAPSWFTNAMQTKSNVESSFHGFTTISVFEGLNLGPESERESSVSRVSHLMRTTEICSEWTEESEPTSNSEFLIWSGYADDIGSSVHRDGQQDAPVYIPDFELSSLEHTETKQISEISNPSSNRSSSLATAAGVQYFMPWIPVDPPPVLGNQPDVFFEQMHIRTRMTNGRIGLLVDPGAFDNLCGSHWLVTLCMLARQYGLGEEWYQLSKVLGVEGVGKQAQEVTHGVRVPIALDSCSEQTYYDSPVVQDSYIPALLGLRSLEDKESVLDMRVSERKLYCGPVDIVPREGCVVHQLVPAASGHLLLPCDNFDNKYSAASADKKPTKSFHSSFK